MSIRVALYHQTTYKYDRPVRLSPHLIRLRPAPRQSGRLLSYELRVSPADHMLHWQQDAFANYQARVTFPAEARAFTVDVRVEVDMTPLNPFDFFLDAEAVNFPFAYPPRLRNDLFPYLLGLEGDASVDLFIARPQVQGLLGKSTVDFLLAIAGMIFKELRYETRLEQGVQTAAVTLDRNAGSCRDSAWLLVQILRGFGLAARFVSGYLIQLAPQGSGEADSSELHAWCEAYLPGAGWVGIDATSGLLTGEGHLPLAASPDPLGATPISGTTSPSEVEFSYTSTVQRLG